MEENTFLDYNPNFQQETPNFLNNNHDNAISRWLNPQIAEEQAFQTENYFMDKENAFNEYMFNKANEYNSPAAQMERAKEAGINPQIAAAGIMGSGNATAVPMQGAKGSVGMNTNTINPIETIGNLASAIGTGISGTNELGQILGFGKKNVAEIQQIRENVKKLQEDWKFTRQQRRQLISIGEILVDNAKLEGKQIETNIENLKRLNEVYQQEKYKIAAETNLITEQTGTEIQNQKSVWYDNMRKEYEKNFRDMFGAELTHEQMQFLVEAAMNGHGDQIINYFIDNVAGAIKGIKERIYQNNQNGTTIADTLETKGQEALNSIINPLNEGINKLKRKADKRNKNRKPRERYFRF